jgi:hypothetical protein
MWEVLLKGAEQGLEKEAVRFAPSRAANPYREIFFKDFNKPVLTAEPIDVNVYYRYGPVFDSLLCEDMGEYPEFQSALFDVLAHYLSDLDLLSGLCQAEYYARFLLEDIAVGILGKENAERLKYFSGKEKRLMAAGLLRMYKTGTSMRMFAQLLRELYPNSIAYLDVRRMRDLLIYIGKKKTVKLQRQVELLCDMFIPADYEVKLFWDKHFGLIGADETMEIGQIMMF